MRWVFSFQTARGCKLLPFERSFMRKMMNSVLININHITEKLIGAWVMIL